MNRNYTPHQKRYFAEQLQLRRPPRECEAIASSMSGAKVDLNPHQVEAARFALQSPISNGTLLADEVGLGKTIEAGLVLTQVWAERKKKILLILPASIRVQWKSELEDKFNLPAVIVEKPKKKKGVVVPPNPFQEAVNAQKIVICSIEFAAKCCAQIENIPWDLVVIDEAHRLRNVYKGTKKATAIKDAISGRKKLLLTATPLQNDLKEMYGITSIIDDHIFGDAKGFSAKNTGDIRERLKLFCKRTLRNDAMQFGLNFTNRNVLTFNYTPSDDEQRLYALVSEYLQDDTIKALPEKGRQLVIMVARKLLASSTFAINKTLGSFKSKLERLIEGYNDDLNDAELQNSISEDFEEFADYDEEFQDEDGDDDIIKEETLRKREQAEKEIARLEEMCALADRIHENSKGLELIKALETGFNAVKENKGAEKAVIFTESTRTQNYVLGLLNAHGYKGQVVLLNGSNNDETSSRIYTEWKERHKDDGKFTSRATDIKAAIVEEFASDRAKILIGTEAAAEGINLQFCNMIVNYDLPWNPQRVEQRIGRCHRYGQKYDVVVINFVNDKNVADKRVYQLLQQKFKLFEGVFGASNAPISVIESGADFDKSILRIYQECRTDGEIEEAFDILTQKYAEAIESKRGETFKAIFETFDEDVIKLLKDCEDKTRASLDDISRWKFGLFTAYGATRAHETGWVFDWNGKRYIPSWETARDSADGVFLTSDSPEYVGLLDRAKKETASVAKIRFNYSAVSPEEPNGFLNNNPNLTGAVSMDRLTYTYGIEGELEEHLLISVVTDSGVVIERKDMNRIMELPAEVIGATTPDSRLGVIVSENDKQKRDEVDAVNKSTLMGRFAELNAWTMDKETALDRDIADMQSELQLKRGQMRSDADGLTLNEVLELQKEIDRLDAEIDRKQRQKLDNKSKIKKDAEAEKSKAASQIQGGYTLEHVMSFSFEIA